MESSSCAMLPADANPFATRWTRPGAIDYLFPPGQSAAALVDRLERQNWQGQIVGPHGSGKTTLLLTLLPLLAARRNVIHVRLAGGQRRLSFSPDSWRDGDNCKQLVVDGFEQLRPWTRARLKHTYRGRMSGLLVTAHRDLGLPELYSTDVPLEMACRVVAALPPEANRVISERDVAECLTRHAGNMREVLFALYDVFEQRRNTSDGSVAT